ncbi:MAG: S-layer homology domain-containing protein, partial [Armatimonadetes bacterium]|nr:S-layer homology domain-containing protein [Armatimonadota bacterium]
MNLFARTGWGARALMLAVALMLAAAPAWAEIFIDIQGTPAQRAIERLTAKGLFPLPGVRGAPDKFNPTGTVTRADFAFLLVQAIGVDTAGIVLPKFKDAADIPQVQQGAVAAITSLGSVSPQKVELKRGGLNFGANSLLLAIINGNE